MITVDKAIISRVNDKSIEFFGDIYEKALIYLEEIDRDRGFILFGMAGVNEQTSKIKLKMG